jgi:dipeptidyl aminopeptidase/acylaminoacyl peptidase
VRRQLTPDEAWYEQPDVHDGGMVSATRIQMQTSIWSYPIDGTPQDNVSKAWRVTSLTGQLRTPTADPNSDQIAFLNDTGGHSNIWVASGQGQPRQITLEDDPAVSIGVPIWSPDGGRIGFVSTAGNIGLQFGLWLVKPDGSDLRKLVQRGLGMAWAPGSDYVYFVESGTSAMIKKVPVTGDPVAVDVPVQDRVRNLFGAYGPEVFYVVEQALIDGRSGFEIRKARTDTGQSALITRIPAEQVESWQVVNPSLSPDGKWVALLLTHGLTTNIFVVSSDGGPVRQITDFGGRAMFIVRRVSWSRDGKSIIAAVGEGDADVVLLDRLPGFATTKGP